MGVNWAVGLIRWKPHVRRNGSTCGMSHLHPFRFQLEFAAEKGRPARAVEIHVGFSFHVFTCRIEDAGPYPELYSDNRETRAFHRERYEWSHSGEIELVVQSAYLGRKELRPRGQTKKPIGFRVIVSKLLRRQPLDALP